MSSEMDATSPGIFELVPEVDPNGGRCLLENQTGGIEFCHYIPMGIRTDKAPVRYTLRTVLELDYLEWFWNMRYDSLSLDTRYNIFCVGARFRQLYDQHQWILIPEDSIIQKYHESLILIGSRFYGQRKKFPEFPDRKTFFYRLMPLKDMGIPIMRLNSVPTNGDSMSLADFTPHLYPYTTLPMLESHIHPHFVIFGSGARLRSHLPRLTSVLTANFPGISLIMDLFHAWTQQPSEKEIKEDPSYNRDSGDDTPSEADTASTGISELVLEADPNGGRCLLENQTGDIEFCHYIPMKIMTDDSPTPCTLAGSGRISQLKYLEWFWNMQRGSLSPNTHYNIFCVGVRLRQLYDQCEWILIPEESVIQKYHESLILVDSRFYGQRKQFPEFPDRKTFLYKLMPLKETEIPIMRLSSIPTNRDLVSLADFTPHLYPYTTLPVLESHLHPHFVIFESGRRLHSFQPRLTEALTADFPGVSLIVDLYRAWTQPPSEIEVAEDISYDDPNDNSDESDSGYQTPPRRPMPRKRPKPRHDEEDRTPPRRSMPRKRPKRRDDEEDKTPPRRPMRPKRRDDEEDKTPPRRPIRPLPRRRPKPRDEEENKTPPRRPMPSSKCKRPKPRDDEYDSEYQTPSGRASPMQGSDDEDDSDATTISQ